MTRRSSTTLDELRVEARYHRDRFALYRARALTGRPTSGVRLRELQRAADSSEDRFRRALRKLGPTDARGQGPEG